MKNCMSAFIYIIIIICKIKHNNVMCKHVDTTPIEKYFYYIFTVQKNLLYFDKLIVLDI